MLTTTMVQKLGVMRTTEYLGSSIFLLHYRWTLVVGVMGENVSSEITVPSEHFIARGAHVRFEVRVGQQMSLEIGPLVESS